MLTQWRLCSICSLSQQLGKPEWSVSQNTLFLLGDILDWHVATSDSDCEIVRRPYTAHAGDFQVNGLHMI
jgi:hypothetical protein